MPKRLDDVAPPFVGGQWRIRFATSEATTGWPELGQQLPGNTEEAWRRMRHVPLERSATQKPLSGPLATRAIGGKQLPQWQIDVSSGARVIYAVDDDAGTVWVVYASTRHPAATEAKGKRSSRTR